MSPPDYDTTVAHVAGDLLSADPRLWLNPGERAEAVVAAVDTARLVVARVRASEPMSSRPAEDERPDL